MRAAVPARPALRGVVAVACLATGLVLLGRTLGASRLGLGSDNLGQFLVAVATWLACRRVAAHRGAAARTWRLAGRAALAWAVGEAALSVQVVAFGSFARPSPADAAFAVAVLYALRAPLAFPAAITRLAARGRVLLDGAIVATSALFLVWMLVLEPYLAPNVSAAALGMQLLYPLVDIVIVAIVLATLAAASHEHAISLGLSALGITMLAATNLAEDTLAVVSGHATPVSLLDAGFVVGLSLVGAGAALDGVGAPHRLVGRIAATQRYLPYLPLPVVLGVLWTCRDDISGGPLLVLFALGLLMVARQIVMSAENNALLDEHRRAMAAVAESEQRYRRIVENAAEGMWVSDAHGVTQMVNARALDMLGLAHGEVVGRRTLEVFDALLDDAGREEIARRMRDRASGDSATYEFRLRRRDGSPLHTLVSASPLYDAAGQFEGSLTMFSDITERKALEDRLVEQAHTDALTGLGNRAMLNAISTSALSRTGAALVYCDLDGFKAVNDSLGHSTGDVLLREVARRLRASLRPGDVIVRLGGDEFAALLPAVVAAAPAQAVADRMLEALRDPFLIEGRQLYVTASIGIALTEPGNGIEQLLRNADLAMYAAKAGGRGRHRVYEHDMHAAVTRRMQLEQDLRLALDRDELQVWFQPVVRLTDNECVGAEALVRWEHPEHGLLRPDEFIPVAAEAGLLPSVERLVFARAAEEAAAWPAMRSGAALTLSVNVAAEHLAEGTLGEDLAAALGAAGLPPARLLVELTERSLLSGAYAQSAVRDLHALGCRIALDDFGTGYSSISHLRDFPVHIVKLDRSFVSAMSSDLQVSRLVMAILQLSKTLGIACTAEGVETAAQARRLAHGGCSFAQGYLYAPALPPAEFRQWLVARPLLPAVVPAPRGAASAAVNPR